MTQPAVPAVEEIKFRKNKQAPAGLVASAHEH